MRTLVALLCGASVVLWPGAGGRAARPAGAAQHLTPDIRTPGRRRHGRRTQVKRLDDATADLLGVLAPPLRAGVSPLTALGAAQYALPPGAPVADVVDALVRAGRGGGSLADVWFDHAVLLDSSSLRFVAAAWSVSETTGAPLADALVCAERVLRARRRAADRLRAAVAGPRASMTVLVLLPFSGPVVGLACGVGPRDLYLSSPVGAVSLLVGVVWAALAWLWAARIVRGAC